MSEHGASLQTYNQELVKCNILNCLEDLKVKRNSLQNIIDREENEKNCLERNIKALQEKLNILSNQLTQHKRLRDNYDKTIQDTQSGFKKILESAQTLLNLAQHEANTLENQIVKLRIDT
ncbi:sjoegren syndrome nuclear autoantigen 1 [Holotrichia oblita]|uniref:Sjoegren syndrome nuclear autoantigen 1 n=2 Tax=Holotrichia oblita TaxID=644536 RepID=A0ACB9TG21_HOLOL|nr:sjoegren syndrome nuclear autoantigen 1 [Holotrichia oblita]KAI4465655.1 sjoegren syndrome nuclear autoantigen 1 [Holotrichia oblita]